MLNFAIMPSRLKIAILCDKKDNVEENIDWSEVEEHAQVTIITEKLTEAFSELHDFHVVCLFSQQTHLNTEILSQLTNLALIVITTDSTSSVDHKACDKELIEVITVEKFDQKVSASSTSNGFVKYLQKWIAQQEAPAPDFLTAYHQRGTEVFTILKEKDVQYLYHANTVATALTFIEEGALLSRHYVESNGLFQTPQDSDEKDKHYGIWDDVFIDGVDNHFQHKRHNIYGPVLFVLKPELLLEINKHPLLVTRYNPQYWDNFPTWKSRYIADLTELKRDYKNWQNNSSRMMFTIRSCGKYVAFSKYLKAVVVERANYYVGKGDNRREIAIAVRSALRKALDAHGLEHVPVELKHADGNFTGCSCIGSYDKEIEYEAAWFKRKFSTSRNLDPK